MVKYFSVDWLAQSHQGNTTSDLRGGCEAATHAHRPHIPCMVQPSAPATYGKGYLQPKPKALRAQAEEEGRPRVFGLCSPLRPGNCSSPVSEIGEYSSGYESEAASPVCRVSGETAEKDATLQRRVRTKFTPEQISKLEKIFSKHKYMDSGERVKTAQRLNLTETQVRTWFQNRRMKLKREVQDYLTPHVSSLRFQPVHQVQYHAMGAHGAHYATPVRGFYAPPQLLLQQQQHIPTGHAPPHVLIHHPHFH